MKTKLAATFIILVLLRCFAAGEGQAKPVCAEVVPSGQMAGPNRLGDIKIAFDDGHSQIVTSDGQCFGPKISKEGNILWLHMTGADRQGYPIDEKLILLPVDGKTKELKPEYGYGFVQDSGFNADGSSVIVVWAGRRGPPFFRRYEVATGKVTGRASGTGDYNKLPSWAKPFAKGMDSLENAPPADRHG